MLARMSLKTSVMFINGLRGRGHQRWYADELAEAAGALPQLGDCGVFRVKARTRLRPDGAPGGPSIIVRNQRVMLSNLRHNGHAVMRRPAANV